MELDTRYRLVALFAAIGVFGAVLLFLHLARLAGDAHVDLEDLPEPVRTTLRAHAGGAVVIVQIVEGPTPHAETYRIGLERPDGTRERLWLAADGRPWQPQPSTPAP